MEIKAFDNVSSILKDDLTVEIKKNAKLSIASAYFSIYAFAELKKQLENIEEGNQSAFKDIFYLKMFIKNYSKYFI